MGIKVRCYGEKVGEQIENLGNIMGTRWELIENLKGSMHGRDLVVSHPMSAVETRE
jgi:hypothetical protein